MILDLQGELAKYIKTNPKGDGVLVDIASAAKQMGLSEDETKNRFLKSIEAVNADYQRMYGRQLFVIGGTNDGMHT